MLNALAFRKSNDFQIETTHRKQNMCANQSTADLFLPDTNDYEFFITLKCIKCFRKLKRPKITKNCYKMTSILF